MRIEEHRGRLVAAVAVLVLSAATIAGTVLVGAASPATPKAVSTSPGSPLGYSVASGGGASTASWGAATGAYALASGKAPVDQPLATLTGAHEVFAAPDRSSTRLGTVQPKRPLTGEQTVLPVLAARTGAGGLGWLRVELPGRPNGHTGWIEQRGTVSSTTPWRIVVEISKRVVLVYDAGRPVQLFDAVVGAPSTPTPLGQFFVEEDVQLSSGDVGAPFALALSARSTVYRVFDGGPGQVAIHGVANIGGVLGTAVSHGCVRLDAGAMSWLVLHIAPGVPVTIIP